jgi:hypothetical protein
MFVIPCKYSSKFNFIHSLVDDIRRYHPKEEIVVVDSASQDKSYFRDLRKVPNLYIEDINNVNYDIGAYWHAFKKYNDRPFFYFMHDSMKVKANLDYMKEKDLTILCHFGRNRPGFICKRDEVRNLTKYEWTDEGKGVYGPIFFCKRELMQKLYDKGMSNVIPRAKNETGCMEAAIGNAFEREGYDLDKCCLYGDILGLESPGGKSGPPPHNTSWQFPVEKFYAALMGRV